MLDAVAQHHETPTGRGYPNGITEIGEMGSLLRRADMYTAKLSSRASREPMPVHEAARVMFVQDQGHPMVAALVKEFGIYPPGAACAWRPAKWGWSSSAARPPTRRWWRADQPARRAVTEPVRRTTGTAEYAVVEVLDEKNLKLRVSRERLAAIANASPDK